MAPLILEGNNLGEKHKHYNKLLQNAVSGNLQIESPHPEDDVSNLLMIDIASERKDVTFFLNALKSKDMLYVSRAIKKSTWLITDKTYKHIINPNYLHSELFPQMMTKAIKKFLLHIRIHLKDEERAEEFYKHEKNEDIATKWLCNCSTKFIEENLKEDHYYDHHLSKRLCEKSVNILEKSNYHDMDLLKKTMYFLNSDTDRYLDLVERVEYYSRPTFNAKATKTLMKKCPDRVINNLEKYIRNIHFPTFVKYVKSEDVRSLLLKLIKDSEEDRRTKKVLLLFQRLPRPERYEFIKRLLLEEKRNVRETAEKPDKLQMYFKKWIPKCVWFKYVPFDYGFAVIKRLLQPIETSEDLKSAMLQSLIFCANNNLTDIQSLLRYYKERHMRNSTNSKLEFIVELNKNTEIHKYDKSTWELIDDIFISMALYNMPYTLDTQSSKKDQNAIQIVIVYKVLHDQIVPEVILHEFKFVTLKAYKKKLNEEEGQKVFTFLYNYLLPKLETSVATQDDFTSLVRNFKDTLTLLNDWQKHLSDFPNIVHKVKEIASLKREKYSTVDLSGLYNVNKSWRKLMFAESIVLNPSEEVCVNALKHGPELLTRYSKEVQALQTDDNTSLKLMLHKIRTYWSESLALNWSKEYQNRLKIPKNHKALTRGMCYLFPHTTLIDIIVSFVPKESKINYSNIDELNFSLQTHFAKNMHLARPQPSPDVILSYAKGDYIKFALPSLLAIFYNLDGNSSRECLPKLLDVPVSLQKHIIRLAFADLEFDELAKMFSNLWKMSKNKTIRCMVFEFTYQLLCKTKDPSKATTLWETFEMFIDNLSFEEDQNLYQVLPNVNNIPDNIQPHFLLKSYEFLKRLIPNVINNRDTYDWYLEKLELYAITIMEQMNSEFVEKIITSYFETQFDTTLGKSRSSGHRILGIISAYLLCAKDLEVQKTKQEKILKPFITRSLHLWNEFQDGSYFIRDNFQVLLNKFSRDLKYFVTSKQMLIPTAMFTDILMELNKLPVSENYIMITSWKLTLCLTKLLETTTEESWDSKCVEMTEAFADNCLEYLKQDVKTHFQCIYVLFSKVLDGIINSLEGDDWKWLFYEKLLSDKDFIPAFLAVNQILPTPNRYEKNDKLNKLMQLIKEHPSTEVKMHYHYKFGKEKCYC